MKLELPSRKVAWEALSGEARAAPFMLHFNQLVGGASQ